MSKNNSILNHPDYRNEVAHLEGTINEMKKTIKKLGSKSKEMSSKQRKLLKFNDEVSRMDLNNYSNLQRTNSKQLQSLESALDSPYFGRVDFKDANNDEFESLYIGKASFGLGQNSDQDPKYRVIDWKMPIASVFYESENGRATYKTKDGTYSGQVKLKRQYTIKNSQLISFVDDVVAAKIAKTLEKLEKAASNGQKPKESKKFASREQVPEELGKVASKGQKLGESKKAASREQVVEELEKVIARKQKHEKLNQADSVEQKQEEAYAMSDSVLLEKLKQHSDKKLRDIIETIRAEQNRIIRQPLNNVLVVQGAAGSGKSTVGLHRISYLLYNHPNIEPEKVLVVAPNKVFLDYIIELLPGLDAKGVRQLTFEQLTLNILGTDLNILKDEKVEFFLSANNADQKNINRFLKDAVASIPRFKGSLFLIKLIEYIIKKNVNEIIRDLKDIILFEGKLTISRDEQAEYLKSSAPLNNRIETLKKAVEFKMNLFIEKETRFSNTTAKRKELKKEAVQFLNSYFYKLNRIEPVALYKELYEDEYIYKKLYKERYFSFIAQYTLKLLESGHVERDDLAALCYIKHLTDGISPGQKYLHIFADEAQDLSP
jgi:DNA helicase IV